MRISEECQHIMMKVPKGPFVPIFRKRSMSVFILHKFVWCIYASSKWGMKKLILVCVMYDGRATQIDMSLLDVEDGAFYKNCVVEHAIF